MKIYCDSKIRSVVIDGMAPILTGIEKYLPLFQEPEIFAVSETQARVTLIASSASLDLDTIEEIGRIVRSKKATAWVYSRETAAGELQLVIQKDLR